MLNNFNQTTTATKPRVELETLVNTKLPPSPGSVMKLTNLLRDGNTTSRQICQAISYEPGLVARILRLANSPLYSPVNPVISISSAISTIGTRSIYDIAMIELASATFAKEIKNSILAKQIWEHSLAVAIIARELSKVMDLNGTEESFTCGLLHDFGKFILLSHDTDGFRAILDKHEESEMLFAEKEYFGFTHADVGALVVERWNLREEITSTIKHHHNASASTQAIVITHIVEVADLIANINGYGLRLENEEKLKTSKSVEKLRLTEENLQATWENSLICINEVMSAFR